MLIIDYFIGARDDKGSKGVICSDFIKTSAMSDEDLKRYYLPKKVGIIALRGEGNKTC